MTTSGLTLTSRSHSNTQTDTENSTKVTESVVGSEVRPGGCGGWSGTVFYRRVCAAGVLCQIDPLGSSGSRISLISSPRGMGP